MYCQSCGSEVKDGLRYCNRCGANLAPPTRVSPANLRKLIWTLVAAVTLVTLIGFITIFFFGLEIIGRGNSSAEQVVFLMLFTLVVFGIVALLIRQLSRVIGVYLQTGDAAPETPSAKVSEAKIAQLPEAAPFDTIPLQTKQTSPVEAEQKTRKLD